MDKVEKLIQATGLTNDKIKDYTLIVDEKGQEHGMLFFFEIHDKQYKIMLPSPHHEKWKNERPTYQQILKNEQAMLLK